MRLLSLLTLLLCAACNVPPYNETALMHEAHDAPFFKEITHEIDNRTIAGAQAGDTCAPAVLFIHGAPGDWSAWGRYFADPSLHERAFLIALDRPGYGGSDRGQWEISLAAQGRALMEAALKAHKGPFILVGHSYGGPVAFQMAIDDPEQVRSMIILAGSVDPALEKTKWFQYVADWAAVEWLVPSPLNVANQEIMPLRYELDAQSGDLARITAPTVFIQGGQDSLVPPGNADYTKAQLVNAPVEVIALPDAGHFLPWERYDLVRGEILKALPEATNCP